MPEAHGVSSGSILRQQLEWWQLIPCSLVAQPQLLGPGGSHRSQSVSLLASLSLSFSTEDHLRTTFSSQPERESSSPFSPRYPHRCLRDSLPLLEQQAQSRCSATGDTDGWVPGPRAPKRRRAVQMFSNWRSRHRKSPDLARGSDIRDFRQGLQPFHVQRQTHQVPLPLRLAECPDAEPTKSQHVFDPSARGFRDPLAHSVGGLTASVANFCFGW